MTGQNIDVELQRLRDEIVPIKTANRAKPALTTTPERRRATISLICC